MMSLMRPMVLIVEDDAASAELAAATLEPDYDIVIAANPRDALEQFKLHPALVILDLHLGDGTDVIDVFQEMRRLSGSSPAAIILSAADEAETTALALQLPMFRKPIVPQR